MSHQLSAEGEAVGHSRILWLLPISEEEKVFRHTHGLEALEQKFQDAAIVPVDPHREPVIPVRRVRGVWRRRGRG